MAVPADPRAVEAGAARRDDAAVAFPATAAFDGLPPALPAAVDAGAGAGAEAGVEAEVEDRLADRLADRLEDRVAGPAEAAAAGVTALAVVDGAVTARLLEVRVAALRGPV